MKRFLMVDFEIVAVVDSKSLNFTVKVIAINFDFGSSLNYLKD